MFDTNLGLEDEQLMFELFDFEACSPSPPPLTPTPPPSSSPPAPPSPSPSHLSSTTVEATDLQRKKVLALVVVLHVLSRYPAKCVELEPRLAKIPLQEIPILIDNLTKAYDLKLSDLPNIDEDPKGKGKAVADNESPQAAPAATSTATSTPPQFRDYKRKADEAEQRDQPPLKRQAIPDPAWVQLKPQYGIRVPETTQPLPSKENAFFPATSPQDTFPAGFILDSQSAVPYVHVFSPYAPPMGPPPPISRMLRSRLPRQGLVAHGLPASTATYPSMAPPPSTYAAYPYLLPTTNTYPDLPSMSRSYEHLPTLTPNGFPSIPQLYEHLPTLTPNGFSVDALDSAL